MRRGQRLAAAWVVVMAALFALAWWFLVPADPTRDLPPGSIDPTAGMTDYDLGRIELFDSWVGPLEVLSVVVPALVVLFVGFTPLGGWVARHVSAVVRLAPLRVLLVALAVAGAAWLARLPVAVALETVRNRAGSISGGWPAWAVRELGTLVGWWGLAGVGLLLVGVAARFVGRWWWLVLSVVVAVLVGAGSWLVESVSGSFTDQPSLGDGALRAETLVLAEEIGVEVSDVEIVPETPTTTSYNAYVNGIGDEHVVVVYESLLVRSEPAEVRFVLAHELAHVASDDAARRAALTGLAMGLGVAVVGLVATSMRLRRRSGIEPGSGIAHASGVPMLMAVGMTVGVLVVPVLDASSRAIELRADEVALDATDDPKGMLGAVRRAAGLNLRDPYPSWLERISASHPSTAERAALAQSWEP